uniref:Odorant binding protein 27c n=1 Tax=Heliconius charithonia TaxID=33434 RepID=A0AA49EZW6_HELCH|nr:odorant binding protein 27c [Heliconius charithonia]
MNTLWFFLFISIALVKGNALFNVPSEYAGEILEAAANCIDSTGAGADAVQKVISANLENTEAFKKFLYCFSYKSGYVDSKGHFVVDQMTKLIGNHKDKAKFIDALNLCNKSEAGNTIDTAYQLAVCFKDNSPIYFTV